MIYITDTKPLCSDKLFQGLYLKVNEHFKEKIDKKKLREDKNRTLAGAFLFKTGMEKMGLSADAEIYSSDKGKPYTDSIFFNISHSGNRAVCTFGITEIGVDIEKIRPVSSGLLGRIAFPNERSKVSAEKEILRLWTRKEAFAKCLGTGIGEEIWKVDLTADVFSYKSEIYRLKTFLLEDYYISVCVKDDFPPEEIEKITLR